MIAVTRDVLHFSDDLSHTAVRISQAQDLIEIIEVTGDSEQVFASQSITFDALQSIRLTVEVQDGLVSAQIDGQRFSLILL